jgi:TfoX/Sxy family transcriptional regulator of competence genes
MPYDEKLAQRIRSLLQRRRGISERKMFGGLTFLANGKMLCGVVGGDLMVRVGPEAYDEALALPHVRPMDFTGRPLKGLVYVAAAGVHRGSQLRSWVERGLRFARSLPEGGR